MPIVTPCSFSPSFSITRSTGRRYMRVDNVIDERLDPFKATDAAARLLRDNYKRLGAWPLAITAYNHGATGMARADPPEREPSICMRSATISVV